MQTDVILTVAQGKRLIAKGIAADKQVRNARDNGMLAVATGTTDGYVIEELSGEAFDKFRYVTGHTLPPGYNGPKPGYSADDYVVREGQRCAMKAVDAVGQMTAGDVFVKGVNAINYERRQAAVLIGHPTGGTIGQTLGRIISQRIDLVHPVGLEKSIPGDLNAAAAQLARPDTRAPALWVLPGRLFTEIEALAALCAVKATPIAAGGICGAEGAIRLLLEGTKQELEQASGILADVQQEPPFAAE